MPYIEFLQYTFFGNTLQNYLVSVGIFLLFVIGATFLNFFLKKFFSKFAKKTKTQLDDTILVIFKRVIVFIIILGGMYFGLKVLAIPESMWGLLEKVAQVILIIKIFQGITILVDFVIKTYFTKFLKFSGGFDMQMTKLVTRIVNLALWVIAISMILQIFGYNISALVTGLGIGGLAIALAAQETLGNFFSSISIMADKPYKIDDVIKFNDKLGIIKDIGIRTTRIETFAGSKISVPNSEIAKATVENMSKRKSIRYDGQIGVSYESSTADVKKAIALIKDIIKKEKNITGEFRVNFTEFDDFSLRIEYTFYVKNPLDYNLYLRTLNNVNLAIKTAFDKAGIEIAYPTQTLHIIKEKA